MFTQNFHLLIFVLIILKLVQGQVTYTCVTTENNTPGICRPYFSCPAIFEKLKKGKTSYTICPIESQILFVCCPTEVPVVEQIQSKLDVITQQPLKLSEKKCLEYLDAVYEKTNTISLLPTETGSTKVEKCGIKVIELVVGGQRAEPYEFPHMAALGYLHENKIKWNCGGSLISERYILTAAHCVKTSLGEPKLIRIGDINLYSSNDDTTSEEINVEEIITHPRYSKKKKRNDIALLKLERNVTFSIYKRPACLPSSYDWTPPNKGIATGWGHTNAMDLKGSDTLQKVTLDQFTETECNKHGFDVSYETQICFGSKNISVEMDTCYGDSGGPLQKRHSSGICMWEIVGITSFGSACGAIDVPGVYTRVYSYNDWIEEIVWK